MDFRLIQRDHPNGWVNDCGLSYRDPYFRACWGPLLDPWTAHFATRVAELTASGDLTIGIDDLGQKLAPAQTSTQVSFDTVTQAALVAERAGLGGCLWRGPTRAGFCLYRHVSLLNEPNLRRLTDPELSVHASTVRDVNERLRSAGQRLAELPAWVTERVARSGHQVGHPVAAREAAGARLDALQRPGPALASPSL